MRRHTLITVVAFMMLSGCGDGGRKAELERERQRAEQAEKARQEAEAQRQQVEAQRQKAEESKSMWQTVAWIVGVGAVVLLVFGTAMGSSARKDAERRASENNE